MRDWLEEHLPELIVVVVLVLVLGGLIYGAYSRARQCEAAMALAAGNAADSLKAMQVCATLRAMR